MLVDRNVGGSQGYSTAPRHEMSGSGMHVMLNDGSRPWSPVSHNGSVELPGYSERGA